MKRHGHSSKVFTSPTYHSWHTMKRRCNGTSNIDDKSRYAGVTYCERWEDFRNFLEDMGERPEGKTLDRINNDDNYEPSNCRWATPYEQTRNRRNTRFVTLGSETKTVHEWCRELGVNSNTVNTRIDKGWTPERALTQPIRKMRTDVYLTFNGERKLVKEWAKELGYATSIIYKRIRLGWSDERIITEPPKR